MICLTILYYYCRPLIYDIALASLFLLLPSFLFLLFSNVLFFSLLPQFKELPFSVRGPLSFLFLLRRVLWTQFAGRYSASRLLATLLLPGLRPMQYLPRPLWNCFPAIRLLQVLCHLLLSDVAVASSKDPCMWLTSGLIVNSSYVKAVICYVL